MSEENTSTETEVKAIETVETEVKTVEVEVKPVEELKPDQDMIPYARFSQVVSKRKEAEAKIAEMETVIAGLKGEVEKQVGITDGYIDQIQNINLNSSVDKVLADENIDSEYFEDLKDLVLPKYKNLKLNEGEEKPSFSEYFQTYKEAKPNIISAFSKSLPSSDKENLKTPELVNTPLKRTPKAKTGTDTGKVFNMKTVSKMTSEEWKAHKADIFASMRK